MSQDRFARLPREYPRSYVPADFDVDDLDALAPLFDELLARDIDTPEAVEAWLRDQGELLAVLLETRATRYIEMTCDTADPDHEKAFLGFMQKVMPELKKRGEKLDRHYLGSPARKDLPAEEFRVFDRSTENDVALFREENLPLETEETELTQKYQKLCGAMTVEVDGEEVTLQQASKELLSTDRARREDVFRKMADRRLADADEVQEIFDGQLVLREKIAGNAGFDNYRDFRHQRMGRFDYTPDDCTRFHDAVETHVMPVIARLNRERRERLGVETLRPWDLSVDTKGRDPLSPFSDTKDLIAGVSRIFHRLDPVLGGEFDNMRELDLLDLDSRKGKAPGGYQYGLSEARLPFIFMNAVGLHGDVRTLLHEGGHAFHSMASREQDLLAYRHAPMEFCEVASMSMELLGAAHLDEFYDEADAARAKKEMISGAVEILPWVATIDAFQHWIYTHPGHSREERTQAWREIFARFTVEVDYTGLDDVRDARWLSQSHVFQSPFYYIEYGIAQLGALQVWTNARKDPAKALELYREALALGGSRPLPELFEAAGTRFDFGPDTVGPLVEAVLTELETLGDA
ncbi:MAG: M3 family oligoendopeptidase [Planctomycetota bacterium]